MAPDAPSEGVHPEPPCSARDTHISWLFFTPDRVLKMNKPVRLAFLDHSTPERRMLASDREIELNRRISPDVYLGHADVIEDGRAVDRLIVMRRLPSERALSLRLLQPGADDDLRRVARAIAAFHESLTPIRDPMPLATAHGLLAFWTSSVVDIRELGVIDAGEADEALTLATAFLRHHGRLLDQRRADGMVRDGHGDLIADDIFMLDDGPRILDCLAFDDDYRVGDVLNDIAFLVMDVERLAGEPLARQVLRDYCEFTGERHPAALAHHYIAYRAHVRAKVASMRVAQGDERAIALARAHHDQALDHLRRAQATVVLVGGGPGTGKTTLARELSDRVGWAVLDSDTVRKDLFAVDYDDHDVDRHPDLYASDTTELTYDTVISRAAHLLDRGESVILDATWTLERFRTRARALARRFDARLVEAECVVDDVVARTRIRDRLADGTSASDATEALVGSPADPWPTALAVDTSPPLDEVADHVMRQALLPWM